MAGKIKASTPTARKTLIARISATRGLLALAKQSEAQSTSEFSKQRATESVISYERQVKDLEKILEMLVD